MQQSLQVWRRSAPHQSRCRCLAHRSPGAVNLSQPDAVDNRPHMVNVTFKVDYRCPYGQGMALVGNTSQLGNWSPKRGQRMHWSRGDEWSCDVMLPAGTSVECKYVIVDEQGQAQRWQDGGNMVVLVPATCQQGLPIQRYDVGVSWCQNRTSFRAHPRTSAAAPAADAQRLGQASAPDALPASTSAAATAAAVASGAAAAAATAASSSAAAVAPPVMAWARSKGASVASEPRRVNPAAAAQAAAARSLQHAPAAAAAVVAAAAAAPQTVPAAKTAVASPPPPAEALARRAAPAPAAEAPAGSKVATLVQAAASAVQEAAAATTTAAFEAAAAVAAAVPSLPAFHLSPSISSGGGADGETAMSIVLPSRSHSPPVKISLSSSFSKLMEMPALARGSAAASPVPSPSPSSSPSTTTTATSASPSTPSSIVSHPIDVGSSASNGPSRSPSPALATAAAAAATGHPPVSPTAQPQPQPQPQPASSSSSAAAAAAPGQGHSQGRRQAANVTPASPIWGMEYDVYAAAYGFPYMHTPFDLEAYAVYDQEQAPSPSSAQGSSHGSLGLLSASQACGADPVENAVQAAHCSETNTAAAAAAAAPAPAPPSVAAGLLSTGLLGATAASAALAMSAATATDTCSSTASAAAAAAAVATAPQSAAAATRSSDAAETAPAAAPLDVYRQVSRSSTSVSDWAGRTLFELGSGHSLLDDDSDSDETADDEAAVAQALAAPAGPADMAALLTQLGTALGRSVRMRYDGVDATAQDLLELDRKIALAASKLYRQRDGLLSGWVRKEARRHLATAAAPSTRPHMPGSNTVTPV
ncbi:hypothetical protein PLESTB_000768700 [Pleodorina starrii]|uniref:CBM20 domain-containing protein n=1 Tax=Pleodorina starrii TaxID=330485 RepID=A0A9W6BK17_9CHLO|nr:hypothetical protein PLESTM_000436600 [Pleodorina starrii]GLC53612.1 hypothetical protein PLESTB_000768700 [Pleodorina starrii]GLC65692.1 hypothetical protein PLESTF_000329600 [Pleodorina starrii]